MLDSLLPTPSAEAELSNGATCGYAKPTRGRSLGGAVLGAQAPFRRAVAALENGCSPFEVGSPLSQEIGPGGMAEPLQLRLAWFCVNIVFVHAVMHGNCTLSKIEDAVSWFFESDEGASRALLNCFTASALSASNSALELALIGEELLDLYPYIIEPHGHVSRACIQNDHGRAVRESKKTEGVYYTPADVANFMVAELASSNPNSGAWLDPACGTGVFLRAIVRDARRRSRHVEASPLEFITRFVYGMDKSALAIECAGFVLLTEVRANTLREAPYRAWVAIMRNLACRNALTLKPNDTLTNDLFGAESGVGSLTDIFPQSNSAPVTYLVMNPPYAGSTNRELKKGEWHAAHASLPKIDLHLAFMEMMWRVNGISSAAAVLPLSVATNTTSIYSSIRKKFLSSKGTKEFLFFDREPQALFGEDVKTRNAIVFRFADGQEAVRTSSLMKWTGAQRAEIFSRNRAVDLPSGISERSLPKLGTEQECKAYKQLKRLAVELNDLPQPLHFSRASLAELATLGSDEASTTIAVSGTAYNFLNAFRVKELLRYVQAGQPLSTAPLISIRLDSPQTASAAYALLTSRIVYWLWRVEGDGFHVTTDFIQKLPIWAVFRDYRGDLLSSCGDTLANETSRRAARSVNAGKITYSFPSQFTHQASKAVEKVIFSHLSVDPEFERTLDAFVAATVSIDGKSRVSTARSITEQ